MRLQCVGQGGAKPTVAATADQRQPARTRGADLLTGAEAIIRLTTNTLLSRKRPAQFATQLACDESSVAPGLSTHLSKQMSVSFEMAAWMTAFWFSDSMNCCSSRVWLSLGSGPPSMMLADGDDVCGVPGDGAATSV